MATQKFQDTTGKMARLCRRIVRINIRWSLVEKARAVRRFFTLVWDSVAVCSARTPNVRYRRLSTSAAAAASSSSPPLLEEYAFENGGKLLETTTSGCGYESDSDLVSLKISLLGDCQIGKTSFVVIF